MGIIDKVRGLGLGLLVWILAVPIFLFTIFPLVSSTSSGVSGIYLVELLWNTDNDYWLRVGYYGLCLTKGSTSHCSSTTGASAKDIGKHWGTTDKLSIEGIEFAMKLQHDVFVAFMTAGGVDWLVSLGLATLVVLRGSRAGRIVRLAAKITAISAAMLMFASAWATNSAAAALRAVLTGKALHQGTLLVALQWIAAILSFVHAYLVTSVADSAEGGKGGENYYIGR